SLKWVRKSRLQRAVLSYTAPSVKVKLLKSGFHSAADLFDLQPPTKQRGSQKEAVEVLQPVRCESGQERAATGRLTAQELLETEQELGTIFTFCSALNTALGGGRPAGKSTEVCEAPGVGKAQLCIQLVVDVQIPMCFGGLGGKALYIDTEGSFLVQRTVDLSQAAVEHYGLLAEDAQQQEALKELTVETIFSTLVRYHDYVELLAEMYLLADFLAQHPEVQLVVIDSIAFPFHHCFDDLSQKTRLRNSLTQQLIQMATNRSTFTNFFSIPNQNYAHQTCVVSLCPYSVFTTSHLWSQSNRASRLSTLIPRDKKALISAMLI
uniref:DNA repair protein RAD51 homolog 3 n=1 Tax=Salmo trutta TaxID=8032 RepID=A0A673WJE3_SALTR